MILKTEHATIHHDENFTSLKIEFNDPKQSLDLMDIKKIYAEFFRKWLHKRIDELPPDEVINLGYYVGREYSFKNIHL